VAVVSVEDETVYAPVVGARPVIFLLLAFGQNIVQSIVEGFIGAAVDGSPIRNHCKFKREVCLHRVKHTVGIYTKNFSEG
jgi:hypothetical protein